jgi:hypothetical protein
MESGAKGMLTSVLLHSVKTPNLYIKSWETAYGIVLMST